MDFFYHLNRLSPSYEARYHMWVRSYVCYRSIAAFAIKKYWMFIEYSPAFMMIVTFSKMQPAPVEL